MHKAKKLDGVDMFDMSDTRTDKLSYLLISRTEPLGARLPDFRFLYAKFYSLTDPLEVKRCRLVRQWLQLPQSVPLLPLLHELGSEPLVHCFGVLFVFITALLS